MVKEYQGFLCTLFSSYVESLPKHTYSVLALILIEYFNQRAYEEVPDRGNNNIIQHLTKDESTTAAIQWSNMTAQ